VNLGAQEAHRAGSNTKWAGRGPRRHRLGFDRAGSTSPRLNSCKDFDRAVKSRRSVVSGPNRARRVAVLLLSLAGFIGLVIAPAGVLADAPGASPSPSPSPSPTTSPLADVARQGPPRPAASPSPANPGLQNRLPQGQLIADLRESLGAPYCAELGDGKDRAECRSRVIRHVVADRQTARTRAR